MSMGWRETYGQVTQNIQGSGTAEIVSLFEQSLAIANDESRKQRIADKGTDQKTNPYVTDAKSCPRKVWFSLKNIPETEPLTTQSLINFGLGHSAEEFAASIFERFPDAKVERELRIEIPVGQTCVSGRIDFLIELPSFNSIVELKTTSSLSMKYTLQGLAKGEKQDSHEKYRAQANLYLHASQLGLVGSKPYETAYLIYLIKDAKKGQEPIQAFKIAYNQLAAEGDLRQLALIKEMAVRDQDPGVPVAYLQHYTEKGKLIWNCSYCSYKSNCWGKGGLKDA